MKVIGYTYDADKHCVGCTEKHIRGNTLGYMGHLGDMQIERWLDNNSGIDTYTDIIDPMFSTDEWSDDDYCSDCKEEIN